jgi:hypothetical protein
MSAREFFSEIPRVVQWQAYACSIYDHACCLLDVTFAYSGIYVPARLLLVLSCAPELCE